MRHATLLLVLLCTSALFAQKPSSFDTRLATGAGPYPFYIALQGVHTQRIGQLDRFAEALAGSYSGLSDHVRLNGIEGMLGVALNDTRPRRVHGLRLELSFQHVWRSFDRLSDPDLKLRVQQDLLSFRVGFRYNIFYPITL
ncbi:MAG TPA: hypothetical protein VHL57_02925, partial [Flavobacteriales bacterium]|nr:hypothetical protein [Flavobacteriales bacterium]